MKRKVWMFGLVALAVPLWAAQGSGRTGSKATAEARKAAPAQQGQEAASEPGRVSPVPRPRARRPHPGLLLGARLAAGADAASRLETATAGSGTAEGGGT